MGTPRFAAYILEQLLESKQDYFEIVAVISQPDKRVGRKRELMPTEVKVVAVSYNLPILQPDKIGEAYAEIAAFKPDLLITAAYGQLVLENILNLPTFRCINVHGSLLPLYRGGAPIHYALLNGDKKTGITIMYMEKKLDAGAMLCQKSLPIDHRDTLETLFEKMQKFGAEVLLNMLPSFFAGALNAIAQNEAEVSYAPNITRTQQKIDWSQKSEEIFNHVRAFNPMPATFTIINDVSVKIFAVEIVENQHSILEPGTVIFAEKAVCYIKTGDGVIAVTDLQISGKKRQNIQEVMQGVGKILLKEGGKFE